jgi:UDP-N-acetylmuramyl-tripeptide synthetase
MMAAAAPDHASTALRASIQRWLQAHVADGADLRIDSRQIARGDVFVALPGLHTDGTQFIGQAFERGAAAILVDERAWLARMAGANKSQGAELAASLPVLAVPELRAAIAAVALDHYGDPSARLRSIGITGTNGKTSSCQWIAQLLTACGQRCATLGTLGYGFPDALDPAEIHLTTPDVVSLQRLARRALDQGAGALATEVSSIGLEQGRTDGFTFHVALFTNLTRDHLDYHPDMAAYGAAKRRLFDWPTLDAAVLNLDDEFGRRIAGELLANKPGPTAPRHLRVIGVGVGSDPGGGVPEAVGQVRGLDARLRAEAIDHQPAGMGFTVVLQHAAGEERARVETALIGEFNVPNLLGVLGVAWACGIGLTDAASAAARLRAPPGRLQQVFVETTTGAAGAVGAEPMVIVDYAHTPDAIGKALQALRPLARARGGRLCIVFGAGGDRDPGKRPAMAAAAAAAADKIVLTSDNPRSEPAESIIDQLLPGLPAGASFVREADRGRAICLALRQADVRDVVLIAGKGHEEYQEVAGRRLPFSDVVVARAALSERRGQSVKDRA